MHVRGLWRAYDMTYLVERRFERFLREFRLETQELRRRLMGELNPSSNWPQPSRGEMSRPRCWMEGR
jgi:hypothetical protein